MAWREACVVQNRFLLVSLVCSTKDAKTLPGSAFASAVVAMDRTSDSHGMVRWEVVALPCSVKALWKDPALHDQKSVFSVNINPTTGTIRVNTQSPRHPFALKPIFKGQGRWLGKFRTQGPHQQLTNDYNSSSRVP